MPIEHVISFCLAYFIEKALFDYSAVEAMRARIAQVTGGRYLALAILLKLGRLYSHFAEIAMANSNAPFQQVMHCASIFHFNFALFSLLAMSVAQHYASNIVYLDMTVPQLHASRCWRISRAWSRPIRIDIVAVYFDEMLRNDSVARNTAIPAASP